MKRFVSVVMAIIMVYTLAVPAHASENTEQTVSTSSFVDSEGKLNSVDIIVHEAGNVTVKYYIENTLINTVTARISVSQTARDTGETVFITYTDASTNITQSYSEPLSNYITTVQTTTTPSARASYIYQGNINYNTYYDSYGGVHNDKLSVYYKMGATTYEYKTVNATEGAVAAAAISALAAILSIICPLLSVVATDLFYAAAYAVGVSIIGGYVQGAISKQYYVCQTVYDIKAVDTPSLREQEYEGLRYRVALTGGGYSSTYYYEGYMPWNSDNVAYWLFPDFWTYQYPGVSSYS